MSHPILLYDGVCGLCNRLVQFVLRRDPAGVFRFAALQRGLAAGVLARHGVITGKMDTVFVVVNYGLPDERLLVRSDAVSFVLRHLGRAELRSSWTGGAPASTQSESTQVERGFWPVAGRFLELVPRSLREWGYRCVARLRYRIFGRYGACLLPDANQRDRFRDE